MRCRRSCAHHRRGATVAHPGGGPRTTEGRQMAALGAKQWCVLDGLDVDGLGALVALLGVVGHLGALGERTVAVAHDRLVMDEEVLARLIGSDEAEALLVAEPLHGSCWHCCFPPGCWVLRTAEVQ